jgi:NADPH:quinone reductase-like Zn-dependent oxidoreductase
MMRAIDQHRLRLVVERVFAFEALKATMAYLKSRTPFGKIVIGH